MDQGSGDRIKEVKIGFTGTQQGMTDRQVQTLAILISELSPTEFHHGDCVGADNDAHLLVRILSPTAKVVVHPPINEAKRAFVHADVVLPPKDYLDRNHDIVDSTDIVFATPAEKTEVLRSGTWATIRYADKQKKTLVIVWPDGTYE